MAAGVGREGRGWTSVTRRSWPIRSWRGGWRAIRRWMRRGGRWRCRRRRRCRRFTSTWRCRTRIFPRWSPTCPRRGGRDSSGRCWGAAPPRWSDRSGRSPARRACRPCPRRAAPVGVTSPAMSCWRRCRACARSTGRGGSRRQSLADIGRQMALHRQEFGIGGRELPWWPLVHLRGVIYQLGRLQFQREIASERLARALVEAGSPCAAGEPLLAAHIPACYGPLVRRPATRRSRWRATSSPGISRRSAIGWRPATPGCSIRASPTCCPPRAT